MKLLLKPRTLLTAFIAAGLIFAPSLSRAEGEDRNTEEDDSRQPVSDADVSLVANPAAPFEPGTPGISGKAFLLTFNDEGVITRTLDMQIFALAFGEYVVTATSLSTGAVTQIGTLSLVPEPPDPVLEEEDLTTPPSGAVGDGEDEDEGPYIGEDSYVHFGGDGTPWPATFDTADIAKITISTAPTVDAGGNPVAGIEVVSADFNARGDGDFNAAADLEGDEASPEATGTVTVLGTIRQGKVRKQRFELLAAGLPARERVVVTFNNGQSLKARTSSKGTLALKRMPAKVRTTMLHEVQIKSALTGAPMARARF